MTKRMPARMRMVSRAAIGVVLLWSAAAIACQVPVFRYALERWNADRYRITVIHDKPLTASESAALEQLKQIAQTTPGLTATADIQVLAPDDQKMTQEMSAQWSTRKDSAAPLLLAEYPLANNVPRTKPMFAGTLTESSVAALVDSPVRKKIAKRLAAGDSAVWIFVPCGREDDDSAARERLNRQLKADEQWLELPSAEELEVAPETLEQVSVPLRIQFSVLTLDRNDPAEQFLLQSLLHSEEDLVDFDEPLAFPVFGRGRVLYALVGKGIAEATVRSASAFMAGPCSCQVKNQNPGFDLLLKSDWNAALGDVMISEPIEGVDREANAPETGDDSAGTTERKMIVCPLRTTIILRTFRIPC